MLERRMEVTPDRNGVEAAVRIRRLDPHLALAGAAVAMLVAEIAAHKQGSAAWIVLAAAVAAVAFLVAWQTQERLRLVPLLILTLAFNVAWIGVDLALGTTSVDSAVLYRIWGNSLLHGHYPDAQYPPAAVLLFAFDALIGGGPTRTAHAFVMVPFQLLTVAAVWALRTRTSAWLAALVALWPLNAFSWEFRFDLVPTALLALGLVFALRERWALAGALLGLGAAAKWTPLLACALLAVWLLAGRRWRPALLHILAFTAVFVGLHLPFLIWSPHHTLYAYRYFHSQGVTGESLWYLLLAPVGHATVSLRQFWLPADVPNWVNPLTTAVQVAVLVALAAVAWRVRASARAGIAVAAMAPVFFLFLNRVFSPQYLVLTVASWTIAGALVLESRRGQLLLGAGVMLATTANALVYPYTLHQANLWRIASAVMFAAGLSVSLWLVARAIRSGGVSQAGETARGAPVAVTSS
jgi:Glycosyltransferase family 87